MSGSGAVGRLRRDERGILGGCLVRALIGIVVLALVLEEAAQLLYTQAKVHTAARAGAEAAADIWFRTRNPVTAETAAIEASEEALPAGRIVGFRIDSDGLVTVTVRAEARTLLIRRISFIRDWGIQHGTETAIREN